MPEVMEIGLICLKRSLKRIGLKELAFMEFVFKN
jgi:hypothetical protein